MCVCALQWGLHQFFLQRVVPLLKELIAEKKVAYGENSLKVRSHYMYLSSAHTQLVLIAFVLLGNVLFL